MAAVSKQVSEPKTRARKPVQPATDLAALAAHPALRAVIGDSFMDAFESTMKMMDWGDERIEEMSAAHPDQADRIWHSLKLLRPTSDLLRTEMLYRSHCTEILNRVIAGEDTRRGTAVECCIACCETSLLAPLTPAGTGLYLRLFAKAGLPVMDEHTREPYETIRGQVIDEHERHMRWKLTQDWRTLPKVIEHTPGCPATKARQAAMEKSRCVDA